MDAIRLGAVIRAVRIRRGWRQVDLAAASGVSQPTVSRIERGHLRLISVDALLRVAEALEIRIDWTPRWRGGELDRMLNASHAAMHNAVARLFARSPWLLAPETTFAIYGERGTIDSLAFHPPSGALLVIELKTDLIDVHSLMSSVDRYRRLARRIARERGWEARTVSAWVVFRDSSTNRRRVRANGSVLRLAFPDDGRTMRGWLRNPARAVAALSFLRDSSGRSAHDRGVRRVRRRTAA